MCISLGQKCTKSCVEKTGSVTSFTPNHCHVSLEKNDGRFWKLGQDLVFVPPILPHCLSLCYLRRRLRRGYWQCRTRFSQIRPLWMCVSVCVRLHDLHVSFPSLYLDVYFVCALHADKSATPYSWLLLALRIFSLHLFFCNILSLICLCISYVCSALYD